MALYVTLSSIDSHRTPRGARCRQRRRGDTLRQLPAAKRHQSNCPVCGTPVDATVREMFVVVRQR